MPGFVTIEGIDGSGKSTLRARLAEFAKASGENILLTREPGATTLGQALRGILLDPANSSINQIAELFLFAADRSQHVKEIIKPALSKGQLVICDRFIHSTIAYQGYARGINLTTLNELNFLATEGLTPDLVILLDLDPEVGLKRAQHRVEKASGTFNLQHIKTPQWTRFEEQSIDFHRAVRRGFLELSQDPANNIKVINASYDLETVVAEAIKVLTNFLKSN